MYEGVATAGKRLRNRTGLDTASLSAAENVTRATTFGEG